MKTISFSMSALAVILAGFCQPATAQSTLIGTTNFHSYLNDAPAPALTLDEATKRTYGTDILNGNGLALDDYYRPFFDKVEREQKRYEDFYRKKMEDYQSTHSMKDMQAQQKAMINANPIIADMGGVDRIQNMSEAEARQAAMTAATNYAANPFAANGIESQGMTALYQKVVSDPAYAECFNKMSDKEKEAELRKFMANDQVAAKTPAQMEAKRLASELQEAQKNEVINAMNVQQKLAELMTKIQDANTRYAEALVGFQQGPGNHQAIDEEFRTKYNQLPEVVMGEVGKVKDPGQEKVLRMEAATKHRQFAERELKLASGLWLELQMECKLIASGYNDFIASGKRVNGSMDDLFTGTNTEIELAEFELNLLGLAAGLANFSKDLTRTNASWEQHYRQVKHAWQ